MRARIRLHVVVEMEGRETMSDNVGKGDLGV
jgi:hypothetical protein